jgi:hypothetical protein
VIEGTFIGADSRAVRVLLESALRNNDNFKVTDNDVERLLNWSPKTAAQNEIAFKPARVILQDFTGVPAIVDLAAMREAMIRLGGNPQEINPLAPAELVIDHSVQVDSYGAADSLSKNNATEFGRNVERYSFLRWGQTAFSNFKVVPPNTGIVHQVNLEHLARVVFAEEKEGVKRAFPDTLVGTVPIVTDQFATITVVPNDELRRNGGSTLGDLLFEKPGITGSSFAPGASSRPIIRGLDANRVRIQGFIVFDDDARRARQTPDRRS